MSSASIISKDSRANLPTSQAQNNCLDKVKAMSSKIEKLALWSGWWSNECVCLCDAFAEMLSLDSQNCTWWLDTLRKPKQPQNKRGNHSEKTAKGQCNCFQAQGLLSVLNFATTWNAEGSSKDVTLKFWSAGKKEENLRFLACTKSIWSFLATICDDYNLSLHWSWTTARGPLL